MREFTVAQAMQYLRELYPDVAPRNEETLRRAIRDGELKAARGFGRNGHRITEDALMEYSEKYAQKLKRYQSRARNMATPLPTGEEPQQPPKYTLEEILTMQAENQLPGGAAMRLELLKALKIWEKRRSNVRVEMQKLENELDSIDKEIGLLEGELKKYC